MVNGPIESETIVNALRALKGGDFAVALRPGQGVDAATADAFNAIVAQLRETTRRNETQKWIATQREQLVHALQSSETPAAAARELLDTLARVVGAAQGAVYVLRSGDEPKLLGLEGTYACPDPGPPRTLRLGEGLIGQCAVDGRRIVIDDVPGSAFAVGSALATMKPVSVIVLPLLFDGYVTAVAEFAVLRALGEAELELLDTLSPALGTLFANIESTRRNAELLRNYQLTTSELQARQQEILRSNEQLASHIAEIETKNREIESAKRALEDKAEQIALASQYKTEFLAGMSHELRTPLNSLLILAKLLADNAKGRLSAKDVEYAKTIYAAGTDLLAIINDILDLAKIESGTTTLFYADEALDDIRASVLGNFAQLAETKGLAFTVELDAALPARIETDGKRLRQVLKNLLANAFKFTERGSVTLRIEAAKSGWSTGHKELDAAATVIAFAVIDTGIGISESSQELIFNAFQQVDGTTSRRYGGTGLGLSISRELAHLMKGEIRVESVPGEGSQFTLYLPLRPATHPREEAPAKSLLDTDQSWENIGAPATGARKPWQPRRVSVEPDPGAASDCVGEPSPARAASGEAEAQAGPTEVVAADTKDAPPDVLAGRRVLIIDDDIRNIYALTGALEERRMEVHSAESGPEGLDILASRPGIDVVLVDIMMPKVDGYETMRRIRAIEAFRELPVVAVTAKAMKGDREKCLAAGATEYVAKPVDIEHLDSLLRRLLGK